ncbi:carbohydrate-binding module family 50 protein [Collybiopsis luxurians FD-317 M1]|uniref:Carbohydrate-binding module family 50 protein n=1 Tax=Collybiopsis luxurians FD-317 M1 TaxID=944289 RepID=A0A0D0B1R1_9AGAR|nr:carbohydrate-binding module family 50 protein [Collybiopsis luxurians FD-317 M1]
MFARLSLFAMVTALGAILGANVLAQTSCEATYTVVSGDNCVAIASKFNVTYDALVAANPAVDAQCDNLFVGQKLCIPPPCTKQYTVQSGDVCISIANQFNITAAQLEAANPDIDPLCDNLQPGEILCIPAASS